MVAGMLAYIITQTMGVEQMRTVWLVKRWEKYEGSTVLAVAASREKGQALAQMEAREHEPAIELNWTVDASTGGCTADARWSDIYKDYANGYMVWPWVVLE
jgi:hypothetical protein